VDDRSRMRLAVAHEVLQAVRRGDFRSELGETIRSGEHVIVPALPDDPMGGFFDKLRAANGTIYIAVLEEVGLAVLSMSPARPPRHAVSAPDDCPIHRDSHLQMIIDYLRATRGPLTCYEASPSVMVELVDEKPPVYA
jgi:hypothetical protein